MSTVDFDGRFRVGDKVRDGRYAPHFPVGEVVAIGGDEDGEITYHVRYLNITERGVKESELRPAWTER